MAYSLLVRPNALEEIENALDYYYIEGGAKAAFSFDEELDFFFSVIQRNPYFQKRVSEYRAIPLKRFPFLIIFKILEERKTVEILSVFNTNLNPKKYPK